MSESEYQELVSDAAKATDEFSDDELETHAAHIQEFTEEERWVISEMCNDTGFGQRPGSFSATLLEAVFKADVPNRAKLHHEYPALVDAVMAWRKGGNLYARLQAARQQRKEG